MSLFLSQSGRGLVFRKASPRSEGGRVPLGAAGRPSGIHTTLARGHHFSLLHLSMVASTTSLHCREMVVTRPTPTELQRQAVCQHTLPTSTLHGWQEWGQALAASRWVLLATCLGSRLMQELRPEDLLSRTTCGPWSELGLP